MDKPVTLRKLAEELGLSKSAVSLALRDNRKISLETRQRVHAMAANLGYRPDPLIARIAARRWQVSARTHLAFISAEMADQDRIQRTLSVHKGTRAVAEQLGYDVEQFHLKSPLQLQQLTKTLYNRGYQGLILFEIKWQEDYRNIPWEHFSVTGINTSFDQPPYDTVKDDVFEAYRLAWAKAREHGFNRIGVALLRDDESLDMALRHGAHKHVIDSCSKPREVPPVLLVKDNKAGEKAFLRWMKTYNPEVVIGQTPLFLWWLTKHGYNVPDAVGFIALCNDDNDPQISGISVAYERAGDWCMQVLDNRLRLNRTGLSTHPMRINLLSDWQQGSTMGWSRVAGQRVPGE